jgi:hypothetical protein
LELRSGNTSKLALTRMLVLKAYDLVPLHGNLRKMKRKYLVAKKDRTKRQRALRKPPGLSSLAPMRFEGAPPELSDSEDEVMGTWGII